MLRKTMWAVSLRLSKTDLTNQKPSTPIHRGG